MDQFETGALSASQDLMYIQGYVEPHIKVRSQHIPAAPLPVKDPQVHKQQKTL